jgi:hypothetical protein
LEHFSGIEIEEWPARIAATALHLQDHQANLAMIDALGKGPETLPLRANDDIVIANALRTDWEDVTGPTQHLYIFCNPPFVGQYTKQQTQTEDMRLVWGSLYDGYLDYVTAWFKKSVDLFSRESMNGEFGFVTTNSITQGQPVPTLFEYIFGHGWRIRFAHRTFAWTSEAPGAANVHCVITDFYQPGRRKVPESIYDYGHVKDSEPSLVSVKERVNGYLIDGPNILVSKRNKPLAGLPEINYGTQPADGGHLIVEPEDYATVIADPIAAKYLKPFRGGRELIQGLERWCLWLEDATPAELTESPIIQQRIKATRDWRELQTPSGDAFKLRETPALFRPNAGIPSVPFAAIPAVVSETRRFYTVAHLQPEVIVSNQIFTVADPDGFAFAILSSSAFITWQRAIGGRLKSDLRFSNTLVWNTLPLPEPTAKQREAIIAGGQAVLAARSKFPDSSLADLYHPLSMKPELLAAHKQLDKAVDALFNLKNLTESDRLKALFASYQTLTAN